MGFEIKVPYERVNTRELCVDSSNPISGVLYSSCIDPYANSVPANEDCVT